MHRRLPFLPSRRSKATFGGKMVTTNLFERSPCARVMADVPVTVYDVGAWGGVDLDLLPPAFAVDALRRTSRMSARRACPRALARHRRGLGPYVRTTARLLR